MCGSDNNILHHFFVLSWALFDVNFVPVRKHSSGTLSVISQHINVSRYAETTGIKYRITVFETDPFEMIYWNKTTHTK